MKLSNNMTKQHELTGRITNKKLEKVYRKDSSYYGNQFYRLTIQTAEAKEKELLVFNGKLASSNI